MQALARGDACVRNAHASIEKHSSRALGALGQPSGLLYAHIVLQTNLQGAPAPVAYRKTQA